MRMALTILFVVLAGCDTNGAAGGDYTCTNAPHITNTKGAVHGASCTKDADCLYGDCNKVAMQLAGHVTTTEGVCTKNCSCGTNSACDVDDDLANNVHFKCLKAPSGGASECGVQCTSVADCQKVNPRFTACVETSTAFQTGVKVCTIQ